MPVVIDDITGDFFAFWERAEHRPPAEQARRWRDEYIAAHRSLFDASGGRHGSEDTLMPAMARFSSIVPRLRADLPRIRGAIERVTPNLAGCFAIDDADMRWVLLVGLFHADGWLTMVDGTPTCFVAVELLGDLRLAEVLLAHEAAHACHLSCAPDRLDDLDRLGHSLFVEGLAVVASARVVPGFAEGTYLWPGRTRTADDTDVATWVAACESAWPDLRTMLLRNLDRTDEATYAAAFLGGGEPNGLPIRAGYFAGARLVAALAAEHALADLARWPATRIADESARTLEHADRCPPPVAF